MKTLKYCKVREVKSIARAHADDAGIDFYVPTNLTVADMKPKMETTKNDLVVSVENGVIT